MLRLGIVEHLRRRFARFKLRAHPLDLGCLLFHRPRGRSSRIDRKPENYAAANCRAGCKSAMTLVNSRNDTGLLRQMHAPFAYARALACPESLSTTTSVGSCS